MIDVKNIKYLTNRLGECVEGDCTECGAWSTNSCGDVEQYPLSEDEIKAWGRIDGGEFSYAVEMPDGRRGALFLEEWNHKKCHKQDPCFDDVGDDIIIKSLRATRADAKKITDKLEKRGYEVGIGSTTGPFDRLEIVMFVPFDLNDKRRKPRAAWTKTLFGNVY